MSEGGACSGLNPGGTGFPARITGRSLSRLKRRAAVPRDTTHSPRLPMAWVRRWICCGRWRQPAGCNSADSCAPGACWHHAEESAQDLHSVRAAGCRRNEDRGQRAGTRNFQTPRGADGRRDAANSHRLGQERDSKADPSLRAYSSSACSPFASFFACLKFTGAASGCSARCVPVISPSMVRTCTRGYFFPVALV